MIKRDEAKRLVQVDSEYIDLKRFEFRLSNLLLRYPEACPDHVTAAALMIRPAQVQTEYDRVVKKLRELMAVDGVSL